MFSALLMYNNLALLFHEGMMKTRIIQIIMIVSLVSIGGIVVYCTNTNNIHKHIVTKPQDIANTDYKTQDSISQNSKQLKDKDDKNLDTIKSATSTQEIKNPVSMNYALNPTTHSNLLDNLDSIGKSKQEEKFKTQDSKNLNSAQNATKQHTKDKVANNDYSDGLQDSNTMYDKLDKNKTKYNESKNPKMQDNNAKPTSKSNKMESNKNSQHISNVIINDRNTNKKEKTTDSNSNNKTNENKHKEPILKSNDIDTQDNKKTESKTTKNTSNYFSKHDSMLNKNDSRNKNTQNDITETKNKQANIKHLENSYAKEEQTSTNKADNTKSNNNQDRDISNIQTTKGCIAKLSCNSNEIIRMFSIASLDLHANMRAKEEARLKGQNAGDKFMRLWNNTRGDILPKLTSNVSNAYEQTSKSYKDSRVCVANYYTEVLQDFGNGWKDKKGDKSPVYQVTYLVSCKDSDVAKLTILNETELQGQQRIFIRNSGEKYKQIERIPPMCDSSLVYKQLILAGFYKHAMARAQEEGRKNGEEAKQRFIKLWDKTKSQIITKLTAHISNVEDKGIKKKTQKRTCVANYYTEVLQDFGNGWKDKKGDKSPYYIVYYVVSYANNEDETIIIDITAQNKIKTPK